MVETMGAQNQKTFKAKLEAVGPGGSWVIMRVPFRVEEVWGTKARMSVKGTINGYAFRSSIFPDGNGGHTMMVNKQMQAGAKVQPGSSATFTLAPDSGPRVVKVPPDLKKALAANEKAKSQFAEFSYSQRKAYVDCIESAKRAETRVKRIRKAVAMIAAGKKMM
jgi:hypothetical protein